MTLREVYDNPKTTTRNPALLAKRAGVTLKSAKAFLAAQSGAEVRVAWRRPSAEQFAPTGGPAGHWQADTLFLDQYKGANDKRGAILTSINSTTRYAIARPLINVKAASTIAAALEDIFSEENPKIKVLRADGGSEWGKRARHLLRGVASC